MEEERTREQMIRDSMQKVINTMESKKNRKIEDLHEHAVAIAEIFRKENDLSKRLKEESYVNFEKAKASIKSIGECIAQVEYGLTYL